MLCNLNHLTGHSQLFPLTYPLQTSQQIFRVLEAIEKRFESLEQAVTGPLGLIVLNAETARAEATRHAEKLAALARLQSSLDALAEQSRVDAASAAKASARLNRTTARSSSRLSRALVEYSSVRSAAACVRDALIAWFAMIAEFRRSRCSQPPLARAPTKPAPFTKPRPSLPAVSARKRSGDDGAAAAAAAAATSKLRQAPPYCESDLSGGPEGAAGNFELYPAPEQPDGEEGALQKRPVMPEQVLRVRVMRAGPCARCAQGRPSNPTGP